MIVRGSGTAVALLAALSGCSPKAPERAASGDKPDASTGARACEASSVGTPRRVRLLSRSEHLAVVSNLMGPQAYDLGHLLPEDVRVRGVDNPADAVSVTPGRLESYAEFAEKAASVADVSSLAPCADGQAVEDCAGAFARQFGRRAFGRPLDSEEVSRLVGVFEAGREGQDYASGIRLIIEAVLQSPGFLYATELGEGAPAAGDDTVRLTDYEVASRLSFLIAGARPDDLLLEVADRGGLRDPHELQRQAERIMAGPAATRRLRSVLFGWLDLHDLDGVQKDQALFPEFTADVRAAMVDEAGRFVDQVLWRGSGTLSELFTASDRFVPPALRPIYGDDIVMAGDGDGPSQLDPRRRKGILSLPGPLTVLSAPQHSRPIGRGLFILQRLLCQTLPPPPPGVAMRPIDAGDGTRTTRQKYAQHSSDPACVGCHQIIDPIGFGLEQMDAIGRFRTTEFGLPVDSSGALVGTDVDGPFVGPAELDERLAGSSVMQDCFVGQVFRVVEARGELPGDTCEIDWLEGEFARNGGHVRDLLISIVGRSGFSLRQVER